MYKTIVVCSMIICLAVTTRGQKDATFYIQGTALANTTFHSPVSEFDYVMVGKRKHRSFSGLLMDGKGTYLIQECAASYLHTWGSSKISGGFSIGVSTRTDGRVSPTLGILITGHGKHFEGTIFARSWGFFRLEIPNFGQFAQAELFYRYKMIGLGMFARIENDAISNRKFQTLFTTTASFGPMLRLWHRHAYVQTGVLKSQAVAVGGHRKPDVSRAGTFNYMFFTFGIGVRL